MGKMLTLMAQIFSRAIFLVSLDYNMTPISLRSVPTGEAAPRLLKLPQIAARTQVQEPIEVSQTLEDSQVSQAWAVLGAGQELLVPSDHPVGVVLEDFQRDLATPSSDPWETFRLRISVASVEVASLVLRAELLERVRSVEAARWALFFPQQCKSRCKGGKVVNQAILMTRVNLLAEPYGAAHLLSLVLYEAIQMAPFEAVDSLVTCWALTAAIACVVLRTLCNRVIHLFHLVPANPP
jgi:hypothetical protein